MPHFLWVEDFNFSKTNREENIVSSTVNLVFGDILDSEELREELKEEDANDAQDFLKDKGIFLKLNLLEALDFIHNPEELAKIDFVVLDVDMPLKQGWQSDDNNYLPPLIKQYTSEAELERIAGYQLYIDLVIELGFPKSHILFCSNHADYFDKLKEKFNSANIKYPISPNSEKPFLEKGDTEFIKQWLDDKHSDYFVLRRGIIEGCKYLKTLAESDLAFNGFIQNSENYVNVDEMRDYLDILENFLPLRKPEDTAVLYKLFIRTLSHEWEATEPKKIRGLARVMKNIRNWVTHNSALFNNLDEQIVAYLFFINMRLMFDFHGDIQPYEKTLLSLFKEKVLSEQLFNDKSKNKLIELDIGKAYCHLQYIVSEDKDKRRKEEHKKNIRDALLFPDLVNNIQESNSPLREDRELFKKIFYQMFWLINSYPRVITKNRKVEISFNHFDYSKKSSYLYEIARHIHSRSFP